MVRKSKTLGPSRARLVVVSGTPGTGKSTLALLLEKKLGWVRIDWHVLLKRNKEVSLGYNRKKQCYDLDMSVLASEIKKFMREEVKLRGEGEVVFVFDSHIGHLLPKRMVDLCVIMRCSNLKKLKKRLEERRYGKKKVEENLQCEIFDVCFEEAEGRGLKILCFDSAKRMLQKEVFSRLGKAL